MKKTTGFDRSKTRNWRPATQAVRGGTWRSEHGETSEALFLTSGYTYDSAEEVAARFAGEAQGMTYSRLQNPTVAMLEERIALMEGAEACRTQATGMAAMTTALLCQLSAGDHVVAAKAAFGSCRWLVDTLLPRFAIETSVVDGRDLDAWKAASKPNTKLFFFETPANPNMRLVDIAAMSAIARDHGARTVVDNTYATPVLTQPITLGADIVVHSATKYLGGHGDLVGGIALGTGADMQQVRLVGVKDMTGAVMAPFNAMLVLRGLKTLKLRMAEHCRSAAAIATTLNDHPAVAAVHYPGLACFPQHDLARRQMPGFGGMIAFELKGGYAAGVAMMNRLTLVQRAVSLGDAESLIQHPASMTHSTYTAQERHAHGIADGLVRLSVGLEEVDEIAADLTQALDAEVRASVDA